MNKAFLSVSGREVMRLGKNVTPKIIGIFSDIDKDSNELCRIQLLISCLQENWFTLAQSGGNYH